MKKILHTMIVASFSMLAAMGAHADINVGVIVSTTGGAASLGIPERNTVAMMPTKSGAEKINYHIFDDASQPPKAAAIAKQLTDELHVDVVIGPTTTPSSMAAATQLFVTGTPMLSMSAGAALILPMDDKKRWVFKTPQNDSLMAAGIVKHMIDHGVKTVAVIAFSDAYGTGWSAEFARAAGTNLKIIGPFSFNRTDTIIPKITKDVMAANPDAILVAGSGVAAILPEISLKAAGYKGMRYQTHGVANADYLRVGGLNVVGTYLPAGPVLVSAQLPAGHPVRETAVKYVQDYEQKYGKGSTSTFGAHAWDAGLLLSQALPVALGKAKPGTPEFRNALRDALEGLKDVHGAHGVFSMSPANHNGLGDDARVMVRVGRGEWEYQK